ncbi:hypothetical protein C8E00_102249 [Chromohalobacter marismortui]|uniref:Uncharacterized protein n=1 Tax=Chromohalobacter marismortui TaxID=42055 RepID=A0A4R7NST2_9GAMM|nr:MULTISPECIES: hypothetical protein [Chromohalobacter]MCI0509355.1 hypothetical protein [Chromohalobacter sp.]MCI0591834.1 hypothetical protein [Chromohalobacter sp.]TDU23752.1 hypothetical protein C8E00_102249 [Chromohalobacter marismortui]
MIWQLIAAIFAGLGAAGIGLILRQLSGKRLPRWIVPALAGVGMLGYQIYYEYNWLTAKQQQLPDSAEVVDVEYDSMFWRPWTYLYPLPVAFEVIDRDHLRTTEANGQRMVEFILYRFKKEVTDRVSHQAYLMNCSKRQWVPLIGDERQPDTAALREMGADAPLYQALCKTS